MLTITIPTTDVPLLDGDGCNVTINGKPTMLRREGDYLYYEGNRCKILDEQVVGDDVDFIAASHGADDEPHFIIRPSFINLLAKQQDHQDEERTQNSQPDNSSGRAIRQFLKCHSGEVNAEAPHLAVPLYMPLAPRIRFENALHSMERDGELSRKAREGKIQLIAVAQGLMCEGDRRDPLQLILYKDRQGYWTYGTSDGLVEMAVLIDGDGRRYLSGKKLPRHEALRRWMAGFLNWNCNCPGLYRLRYAMIDQPTEKERVSETTSE